ncbi:hypothetical protein Zm00014a_042067 [Zea mays]|uniref:Uncharacterized protein n=1 Tax=Zea mays TaxID=4577 RepID=A0A3L6DTF7_MAIZE|nr:hypothetical protein Zm00014a_042067 [Zea mays]
MLRSFQQKKLLRAD